MSFKEISTSELCFNPFDKIGKEWFLVSSGDESGWNTMTASWGFMGVMWGKNVIETVIRPTRYTYEFIEKNDLFTVSFLGEGNRDALKFCGAHSGRDCDKAKETGLSPVFSDGTVYFEQAELVFVCRKIYSQCMDENLLAQEYRHWNNGDMHKAFYGEIVKALAKE